MILGFSLQLTRIPPADRSLASISFRRCPFISRCTFICRVSAHLVSCASACSHALCSGSVRLDLTMVQACRLQAPSESSLDSAVFTCLCPQDFQSGCRESTLCRYLKFADLPSLLSYHGKAGWYFVTPCSVFNFPFK